MAGKSNIEIDKQFVKEQSQKALEKVAEYFSKETKTFSDISLKEEKEIVETILKGLSSWNSQTSSAYKEMSLKLAYEGIMRFRTLVLGSTSEIQYRLYIRGEAEDIGNVQIIKVSEKELLQATGRDRSALRLKQNLDILISEKNKDNERQSIFNKHFQNVQNGLEHPSKSSTNYVITQDVISKYAAIKQRNKEGRLLAIGELLKNVAYQDEPKNYRLKLFNRGWVYQAFDQTVEDFNNSGQDWNKITKEAFHKQYFTKNLSYDNVVGFKGGDVGLMQIKSNMASLMSKTTLVKYLNIILEILSSKTRSDKEKLKNTILKSFLSDDKITPEILKEVEYNIDNFLYEDLKNFKL